MPKETHIYQNEWKQIFYKNGSKQKKLEQQHSDKTDFKAKSITKSKELFKKMINKRKIFINIYALNMGAPKYINKILININGEVDHNAIIVGGDYYYYNNTIVGDI